MGEAQGLTAQVKAELPTQHASLRLPGLHAAWPATPWAQPAGHAVHASASDTSPGPLPPNFPAGHGAAATPPAQ